MLNSCVYWKNIYNAEYGFFSIYIFHSGGWYFQITLININCLPHRYPSSLIFFLFFTWASFGWAENNKCKPLNLHSLSPYHSRQIVFTLDPTTATKDPTRSSNNSKSNHIGFPFLVSKGHSLRWFFSFNSCKGREPTTLPPPRSPFICSWEWGKKQRIIDLHSNSGPT